MRNELGRKGGFCGTNWGLLRFWVGLAGWQPSPQGASSSVGDWRFGAKNGRKRVSGDGVGVLVADEVLFSFVSWLVGIEPDGFNCFVDVFFAVFDEADVVGT